MSSVGVINISSSLYLDFIKSLSRNCENFVWIRTKQYPKQIQSFFRILFSIHLHTQYSLVHFTWTLFWLYLNFIKNSSCFFFLISNKKDSILTKLLTKPELGTAPAPACLYFFNVFWEQNRLNYRDISEKQVSKIPSIDK